MNAIRKATKHKRKPPRPRVSDAGRRVLEWLADHYSESGAYVGSQHRQTWWADSYNKLKFVRPTIIGLSRQGLITGRVVSGGLIVKLSDLGRSVLRGAE